MRFSAIIGVAAMAAAAAVWASPRFPFHPTPEAIGVAIGRDGARATVNALFEQRRWDGIAAHIARGEPAWVDLAGKLAPGTDAGTAEDLVISLALALPIDPRGVLAVAAGGAEDVSDICGAPFIEGTVRDIPAYKRRAAAAIAKVADPTLANTKAACLDALAKAP